MGIFSQASLDKLKTCHPELQVLFFEVVQTWNCTILEGHRDQVAQDKAFAEGKSKLKYPNGNHNATPSNAVDVAPWPLPNWKAEKDFVYFAGFVMGIAEKLYEKGTMKHKVRYGGDWNQNQRVTDEKFSDLVHFELVK